MIVGLCGYSRVGKDTAAEALVRELGYRRVGLADKVREAALAVDPWIFVGNDEFSCLTEFEHLQIFERVLENGGHAPFYRLSTLVQALGERAKTIPEVRQTYQRVGTEAGRQIHGLNCWLDAADVDWEVDPQVVISDVRFGNEARWVWASGGVVLKIVRPGVGQANSHSSESGVDAIVPDSTVVNGGTVEEFQREVVACVRELRGIKREVVMLRSLNRRLIQFMKGNAQADPACDTMEVVAQGNEVLGMVGDPS